MRMGLERNIKLGDWKSAASAAANLGGLLQARGKLKEALASARNAVDFADKSGDPFSRIDTRVGVAEFLFATGRRPEAAAQFEEAEQMQKETRPHLGSLQGFMYCDFLLDQDRDAEVRERASQTLEGAREQGVLRDIALDHLSLGRAHFLALQRGAGDVAQAAFHLRQAVDGLRHAGYQEHLPRGLFARAALHTHTRAFDLARRDLDEALTLATRNGFPLFEADAHLGLARLYLAEGNPAAAREHLDRARTIVDAIGYHRRDRELAELDAACPAPLQAVDLFVILKLAALRDPSAPASIVAEQTGLSNDAVALSLHRLGAMGLLKEEGEHRRINKLALRKCLEDAVRWIAPAELGGLEVGLPTAHSAPPLAAKLIGDDDPMVIPLPQGPARGRAVTPLHPLAPGAAARDPKLYALLALVDALRIGGAREREVAAKELGHIYEGRGAHPGDPRGGRGVR